MTQSKVFCNCMSIWRCHHLKSAWRRWDYIKRTFNGCVVQRGIRIKRTRLECLACDVKNAAIYTPFSSRSYSQGYFWKFLGKKNMEYFSLKPIHLISGGCHQCKLGRKLHSLETRTTAQNEMTSLPCQEMWFHAVQTTSPHNINQCLSISYQQRHNAHVTCPEKPISLRYWSTERKNKTKHLIGPGIRKERYDWQNRL